MTWSAPGTYRDPRGDDARAAAEAKARALAARTPEQVRQDEAVQAALRAQAGRPAPSPTAEQLAEAEQQRAAEEQRQAVLLEEARQAGRVAGLRVVTDQRQQQTDRMPPRPAPVTAEPSASYDAHIQSVLARGKQMGLAVRSELPTTPPPPGAA